MNQPRYQLGTSELLGTWKRYNENRWLTLETDKTIQPEVASMTILGGANRIELDSQILCAALRQSLADTDVTGMLKACQELYQLFPDLLPPASSEPVDLPPNYYDLLEIACDVNPSMVVAAAISIFTHDSSDFFL